MIQSICVGFGEVMHLQIIILIMIGTCIGIIFGAIPGLTANMAVALCLPISFGMSPIAGMSFLIALYIGGQSGGLISAILLKIPGTAASVATCFDGHPMAQKGQAAKALGIGILYSFIGGGFSIFILIFLAPLVARAALKFGPFEYAAAGIFSLSMVATLISGAVWKGLASCLIGLCLATVGSAPIDLVNRFTFHINDLQGGLALIPALIGLFAVPEVLKLAEQGRERAGHKEEIADVRMRGFGISMREFKEQSGNMLRSAVIGTGIGILPGIGGGTANLLSYIVAKNRSKHPEDFGTGIIDGVIASETANNACIGGAIIPLLTLGIPGDTVTAVLLGALTLHGVMPGPLLFTNQTTLVYGIFAALLIANLAMVIFETLGIRIVAKILQIPKYLLLPCVSMLCLVGAYGSNHRIFDMWVVVVFGIVGYMFSKLDFPIAPIVLGLVLGPMIELNLRRALMTSQKSIMPLFTNPISAAFMIGAIVVLMSAMWKQLRKQNKNKL